MQVVVISSTDEEYYEWDQLEILIDGESVFSVMNAEVEDNTLGRNFSDCYDIPKLLERAYLAGKNGETFEIHEGHYVKDDE